MIFTFYRLAINHVVCPVERVVCRYLETKIELIRLNDSEHMKSTKTYSTMETGMKKRLSADEQRFANEIALMMKMSLTELLLVEKTRIPVSL